jgi:hypothetical protein
VLGWKVFEKKRDVVERVKRGVNWDVVCSGGIDKTLDIEYERVQGFWERSNAVI